MKILILPDRGGATIRAADMICESMAACARTVLGLATGGTM